MRACTYSKGKGKKAREEGQEGLPKCNLEAVVHEGEDSMKRKLDVYRPMAAAHTAYLRKSKVSMSMREHGALYSSGCYGEKWGAADWAQE